MRTRLLALVFCLLSSLTAFSQEAPAAGSPTAPTESSVNEDNASLSIDAKASAPSLDLKPDADGKLSQEQMQQLFRVVAEKDVQNHKQERNYTYIERDVQNNLDGKGLAKSKEIKT